MKQTRNQWAIIAIFFLYSTSLSAQNYWMPIPKEWLSKMMHLFILSKKMPVQNNVTSAACAISNEITITIAPCADALKKKETILPKPIQ
jgi:hypothetical protein